jgi:hypothetical protein
MTYSHSQPSLSGIQQIRNGTSGISQRGGSSSTGKESQDDEGPDVLRSDDTAIEDGEEDVRSDKEFTSTKNFRHWRPKQRTNNESQDETWNELDSTR